MINIQTGQAIALSGGGLKKRSPAKHRRVRKCARLWQLHPESTTAAIDLAISLASVGNKTQAAKIIRPIWRENALDTKTESRILSSLGSVLQNSDHFYRASYLLYRDRANGALRLKRYLNAAQTKLIEARISVIREERKAGAMLKAVPSSMRTDPAIFSPRSSM